MSPLTEVLLKKEFGSERYNLLINLCVKYSPGHPVMDHPAVFGCLYVPPRRNVQWSNSKFTAGMPWLHSAYHFFYFFHSDSIDHVRLFGRQGLAFHSGKNCYQTIPAITRDLIQQYNFSADYKLHNSFRHHPPHNALSSCHVF